MNVQCYRYPERPADDAKRFRSPRPRSMCPRFPEAWARAHIERDSPHAGFNPSGTTCLNNSGCPGSRHRQRRQTACSFAVFPDTNTAARYREAWRSSSAGRRARRASLSAANRMHVTLLHLGNFAGGLPPARVDAAVNAAASIRMEPFSVEFDNALSFALKPRPGPLVLGGGEGVARLHALHDALASALQHAGFGDRAISANTPYTRALMTLAYGMPWIATRPVEAVSWNVREFALVHSLLGRTRHVVLARWPLAAG